ncbi:MAG: alkaline phosphatase family protein [Muribaculaceae bacterium]|nr:alkaline phosphatase family protein [Muribaculaceae bacterium]
MNKLLTTMIVGLAGIQGITQAAESRPKLVVGIVIDQLRTDYLENLRDLLGQGGFKRLMDKGLFIKEIDFKIPAPDAASAAAIVNTGTYPRKNGVMAAEVYNPSTKTLSSVFNDPAYIGNFTSETYSPAALKVTTISDEIALATEGAASIHSIAPDAETALVLAGHAGNSAFWINENTGKWSSTTYYPTAPVSLQNKNYNQPLVSRLDTMRWMPLKGGIAYPDVPSIRIAEGFRYTFPRSDKDVYKLYKSSPYVNSDITDAAIDYIRDMHLGSRSEGTDVLNLGFTLAPYPGVSKGDGRYEAEDAYLRLDNDLGKLFNEIDRRVGLENTLVYVTSTGYYSEPATNDAKFKLPGGSFSVKRALSLLNSFLSAKYGNGSYIDRYNDSQIYLDSKAIEDRGLDINKIAEESRDFLVKISGISDAYTNSDLMSPAVPQLEGHRLAIDPKLSGDILIEFNPGWQITDDTVYPVKIKENKTTAYSSPAFIMGAGTAPEIAEGPVDAAAIAKRVASRLHIRPPTGMR